MRMRDATRGGGLRNRQRNVVAAGEFIWVSRLKLID